MKEAMPHGQAHAAAFARQQAVPYAVCLSVRPQRWRVVPCPPARLSRRYRRQFSLQKVTNTPMVNGVVWLVYRMPALAEALSCRAPA